MGTHDSTDPPAMPPGQSTDGPFNWVIDKAKRARQDSSEALDLSRENSSALSKIVEVIGVSPNQALGTPGSGLLGGFDRLSGKVGELSDSQDKLVKALAAALWVVKIVVGAILVAATGGAIVWVTSLHH